MPTFYALVDAMPGRENDVAARLANEARVKHIACKDGSYDFLIRFDANDFSVVDDFLATHIRQIPGVKGIEVVQDWNDYGSVAREAKAKLG